MTHSLSALLESAVSEAALGGLRNEKETTYGYHRHIHQRRRGLRRHHRDAHAQGKNHLRAAGEKSDNAPDFRVFHITDSFTSEIGAAWKKTSKEGAEYLSVSIDDPSFAERINCRLVKTGSEQGHTLYWERQRPRD